MSVTPESIQALVDQGHQICPKCSGLCRPERDTCPHCHTSLAGRPVAAVPAKRRPATPTTTVTNQQSGRGTGPAAQGSLRDLGPLDLVVHGDPIQQGSTSAPAPGVVKHSAGRELRRWRNKITAEAARVCGPDWEAPNCPLAVSLVLTIPPGAALAGTPDGYRDLDKLVRAVGDGLCPRSGFRTISSDMRIVENPIGPAKTHPRPFHTHPMALDEPGVWIRVAVFDPPVPVFDGTTWGILAPIPDPTHPPTSHLAGRTEQ